MPHEKSYKYARESRNGDCDGLGNLSAIFFVKNSSMTSQLSLNLGIFRTDQGRRKKRDCSWCTVELSPANFHSCLSFQVRVFVSLSHEDQSSVVHAPSAVWAESISTAGFQLCSRATGSTNDTGIINWVAFQDKPMLTHGSVTFSGIWTTETKCEKVAFSQVR